MELGTIIKVIAGAVLGVLWILGWLMALGGVGRVRDKVGEDGDEALRPFWWTVFFQLGVALATVATVVLNGLDRFRVPLIAFMVMSTSDLMVKAELALSQLDNNGLTGSLESGTEAAAGGFILLSVVNFLAIILLGMAVPLDVAWLAEQAKARGRQGQPPQGSVPAPAPVVDPKFPSPAGMPPPPGQPGQYPPGQYPPGPHMGVPAPGQPGQYPPAGPATVPVNQGQSDVPVSYGV